jgi:hypothetical protein
MVASMGTYQHFMMVPEEKGSNIVACLHSLLGLIWTLMVPEEEGLPVPFCVDRRIISLRESVTLLLVTCDHCINWKILLPETLGLVILVGSCYRRSSKMFDDGLII